MCVNVIQLSLSSFIKNKVVNKADKILKYYYQQSSELVKYLCNYNT